MPPFLNVWPAKNVFYDPLGNYELPCICDCLGGIGINICRDGPWIAGGSVVKTLLNKPVNTSDIDIFFPTEEKYNEAVAILQNSAAKVRSTKFSSTFSCIIEIQGVDNKYLIQPIKYVIKPTIEAILDTFDIDVCRVAFDGENVLWINDAVKKLRSGEMLVDLDKVSYPVLTTKRIVKYVSLGMKIPVTNLSDFLKRSFELTIEYKNKEMIYE